MALIAENGLLNAVLAGLTQSVAGTPAENALNGVKVGLFTNTPVISGSNLLTDFTAPTSGGLGLSSTVTWGAVYNDQNGVPTMSSGTIPFIASSITTGDSVRGYYLVAGSGSPTAPLAVEIFSLPVQIAKVGDGFNLVVNAKIALSQVGSSNVVD